MNITRHEVDQLKDPTGILKGDRYEFFIYFEVDEEDELFRENGLYIKLIYAQEEEAGRIANYQLYENNTNEPLEFELEEDELQVFQEFCSKHIS